MLVLQVLRRDYNPLDLNKMSCAPRGCQPASQRNSSQSHPHNLNTQPQQPVDLRSMLTVEKFNRFAGY